MNNIIHSIHFVIIKKEINMVGKSFHFQSTNKIEIPPSYFFKIYSWPMIFPFVRRCNQFEIWHAKLHSVSHINEKYNQKRWTTDSKLIYDFEVLSICNKRTLYFEIQDPFKIKTTQLYKVVFFCNCSSERIFHMDYDARNFTI